MTEEFQKFDGVMRKILSVSREELKKREAEWKRTHNKKRVKTSRASRALGDKG